MTLKQRLAEQYDELMFLDGFDDALMGVVFRATSPTVTCYSVGKMVEILKKDMSEEDALEYLDYNVFNAFLGDLTPVFFENDTGCSP